MNRTSLNFKPKSWLLRLLVAATIATGGTLYVGLSQGSGSTAKAPETTAPMELPGVSALGRLEPTGEIILVAAPLDLDGDRLAELLVAVGDPVNVGDPIAVLDSRDQLQDKVTQAQMQIRLAEAKLAQVKAGAKSGEIAAQEAAVTQQSAELAGQLRIQRQAIARIEAQYEGDHAAQTATIRRLQAELHTAEAELTRYQTLYEAGAVSTSLYDSKRLSVDTTRQALAEAKAILARTEATAQRRLQEARAELARLERTGQARLVAAQSTLNEVAEVRAVDVQMAQAELDAAQASLVRAQNNLAKATIRAPRAGQVLQLYTRPGEQISTEGIVALGQTEQMLAIAEVYQSDISRVALGQQATIRGQAFEGELQGEVIEIGRQISRQNVFSSEPGENLDRRVVEVKIALTPEDSQRVANLSNLQVQIVVAVSTQPAL
ncbi:MAG: HlyD family efflux transporter periplasmic adaptor subunit [Pseudanabaenales cyanobacterium]|nr:HlyD family efflux transporter periplasmic adaptor subunit [Pseudanabaenales cyanobacterium]